MGPAPSENRENLGKSVFAKVPVPILVDALIRWETSLLKNQNLGTANCILLR
jgi:hypothetical protein